MKETDDLIDQPSLSDAEDLLILMHREAHFGGSFPIMLDYYQRGGKGISKDISIGRIIELAKHEEHLGQNLAALTLSAREAEEIAEALSSYKKLKSLYFSKSPKGQLPLLIANLILSEEEEPESEIRAIVEQKSAIVPLLIDLIRSEDMYNPLFPGYGQAPALAARCLGQIGDKRAIIALFEAIGKGDFFDDDMALQALKLIGEPAKNFLLTVLQGKPINEDNERAAIAILSFKDDPQVAEICFQVLKGLNLSKELYLATYLILACEGLKGSPLEQEFTQFGQNPSIPSELKNDFKAILHLWQQ